MRMLTTVAMFLLATAGYSQIAKTDSNFAVNQLYPATALLYSQDQDGNMRMRCTATAIEKNAAGYVFVTAAHCGCEDDTTSHTVSAEKTFFFITADDAKEKKFISAKPIACGYRHAGDDFFLLQIDTTAVFPVIPLGVDPDSLDAVVNVASPLGMGKQVFLGNVSSASMDRPVIDDDINWTHAVLLQLFGTDGGSSGSSVVCLNQKKICAFVVGSVNRTSIIGMPVSRLTAMRARLDAGTYKHWKANSDDVTEKTAKVQ